MGSRAHCRGIDRIGSIGESCPELLRVDVIAILIMVTLPWLGLVTAREAIPGLASNAVVSIIGVMILGYGVDRTDLISDLSAPLVRFAGGSEKRLLVVAAGFVYWFHLG